MTPEAETSVAAGEDAARTPAGNRWGRIRAGAMSRLTARTTPPTPTVLFVAAALAMLTWPVEGFAAVPDREASWETGLHLAHRAGMDFGTDIVFTYGPLGFLSLPRFLFTPMLMAGLAFTAAAHLALAASLLWAMTPAAGFGAAALIAYPLLWAMAIIQPTQEIVVAGLIGAVAALRPGASPRFVHGFAGVMGFMTAVMLTTKFNDGVIFAGMTAIAIGALTILRSRTAALVGFASFVVTFAVVWLGTGQSVGALAAYFATSLEVASGFSASMGFEGAGHEWEYAAAAAVAIGVLAVATTATAGWPRVSRWAAIGIVALVGFGAFKAGFVRHDSHSLYYFIMAGLFAPAFFVVGRASATAASTMTAALLTAIVVAGMPITAPLDVPVRASAFVQQVRTLADPSTRSAAYGDGVRAVRDYLALPPEVIELVRGHRVHIDPWEATAAWAHYGDFDWAPVPVFQTYTAYTDALDELNARALASAEGPDMILRQTPRAIDDRNPHWESPAYTLAMVCNFREVRVGAAWQVLERSEDRCGTPETVEARTVPLGTTVDVPRARPGQILLAAVRGLEGGPLERLGSALYKTGPFWANVDERTAFRLVPGTAGNGLILQVPEQANYSNPFAYPPIIESIRVYPFWPGGAEDRVTIEFLSVPFETDAP